MALVKLGEMVAGAAGKLGGLILQQVGARSTISRNSARVKPYSKQTASRMSYLRKLGLLWRTSFLMRLVTDYLPDNFFKNPSLYWALSNLSFTVYADYTNFKQNGTGSFLRLFRNNISVPVTRLYFIFRLRADRIAYLAQFQFQIYSSTSGSLIFSHLFSPPYTNDPVGFYFDSPVSRINLYLFARYTNCNLPISYLFLYYYENGFFQSWDASSINFPYLNRFGESRSIPAFELFSKLNLNLLGLGLDPVLSPPVKSDLPGIQKQSATATSASLRIIYPVEVLPANYALMLMFSRCVPRSVEFCKESWLKQIPGNCVLVGYQFEAFTAYQKIFGTGSLIPGSKLFCRSQLFDSRSGERLISETFGINVSA